MAQEPAYEIPGEPTTAQRTVRRVNYGRLWAGGLATAAVAALIVVVGVLVARQVLGSTALAGKSNGTYVGGTETKYVLLAVAAALLATVLMHLLLLAVPQPARFFSWMVGLLTAVAVILPFTTTGPTSPKVADAAVNLLVGIAILALLGSIAAASIRRPGPPSTAFAPPVNR